MSDPDDFSIEYCARQQDRADVAGRVIVVAWIFFAGAALGWILHKALA